MADPLKPGDVVKVRSGGPLMTIGWIEHQDAYCTWMDQAGEQKTGMFNLTVLEKMEDYA